MWSSFSLTNVIFCFTSIRWASPEEARLPLWKPLIYVNEDLSCCGGLWWPQHRTQTLYVGCSLICQEWTAAQIFEKFCSFSLAFFLTSKLLVCSEMLVEKDKASPSTGNKLTQTQCQAEWIKSFWSSGFLSSCYSKNVLLVWGEFILLQYFKHYFQMSAAQFVYSHMSGGSVVDIMTQ